MGLRVAETRAAAAAARKGAELSIVIASGREDSEIRELRVVLDDVGKQSIVAYMYDSFSLERVPTSCKNTRKEHSMQTNLPVVIGQCPKADF